MLNKTKIHNENISVAITSAVTLIIAIMIITNIFSGGNIKIIIHNKTQSEQTVWFEPKEKFTYTIPAGKKVKVKYSTEHINIALNMWYYEHKGNENSIELSGYVEKAFHGKVTVKIRQTEPEGDLDFEIVDKIGL